MAQANMSFTFDMMNKLQIPRNHQGLVSQLPIHINPLDADLYTETKSLPNKVAPPFSNPTVNICFKPVSEFISLHLGAPTKLAEPFEGPGAQLSPGKTPEKQTMQAKEPDMID